MSKLSSALKEAILRMPAAEKDKLLLRLVAKDGKLCQKLEFELLEEGTSLEERRADIREFIDQVAVGHHYRQPRLADDGMLNDAENGAKSTMTAIMGRMATYSVGRMATYSGQVITWDEALNSQMSIMPKEFSWQAQMPVNPGPDGFHPIAVPGKTRVL